MTMTYIYNIVLKLLACIAVAISLAGCAALDEEFIIEQDPVSGGATSGRVTSEENRDVFIIWSMGFNNLSSYLKEDIDDIASNWLPGSGRNDDVVLAFCHNTAGAYSVKTSPVLMRIYRDHDGLSHRDTLMTLSKNTNSASSETMNEVLTYIKDNYPAKSYGMLVSSHGTGWIPEGYSSDPSGYESQTLSMRRAMGAPVPYAEVVPEDGMPLTKSIGCHNLTSKQVYEMDITEMAEAIPMQMDYILFDACFMGGVEVAYELKDVCRKLVFSQTEILADGMDYVTMLSYLLENGEPDLVGFCENYFNHYNSQTGAYQSATISLVDCAQLDGLAHVCRSLFESYRQKIASLEGNADIQRYYRSGIMGHRWFFDLESILKNAGITDEEKARVAAALDECVVYKAATENFMQSFQIKEHCGFSMYLPYRGRNYLNGFYKKLKWNEDTSLIE